MTQRQIMGIAIGVVVLIVGLVLAPIVLDTTATVQGNTNISSFSGVSAVIGLVPLLYTVALLGLAGAISYYTGFKD